VWQGRCGALPRSLPIQWLTLQGTFSSLTYII
jgi:hypothetical protein